MARAPAFSIHGLDELSLAVYNAQNIPDDVKVNMVNAATAILRDGQSKSAQEMGVYDPESNVHIANKVRQSKPKTKNGKLTGYVTFSGSRKRGENKTSTRNAEIAFINEFGKKGQPARPFIKTSNEQHSYEAIDAASAVFHEWLDKQNL